MSIGMVALVIFSYFYLKEPLSRVELGGIVAIIIGIIILGVTNPSEEIAESFDETLVKLAQWKSIIFLVVVFIISILLVLLAIVRKFRHADVLFGIAAGITDALGAIFIKAYMAGADFRNWGIIHNSVKYWEWWLLLTLLCLFNGLATIYLQVAYQRGRAVIVAPIFSVLAMVVPVLAGVIIFNDWLVFVTTGSLWRIVLKILAMAIIIAGAVILSIHSARVKEKITKQEGAIKQEANELKTESSEITKKANISLIEQEKMTID
jgi:drug/metabolite transporter (DMT)-like permease